jgi:hypothetical protein
MPFTWELKVVHYCNSIIYPAFIPDDRNFVYKGRGYGIHFQVKAHVEATDDTNDNSWWQKMPRGEGCQGQSN